MAAEIDITYEHASSGTGLQNVKNVIVSASSTVGQWKVQNAISSHLEPNPLFAKLRVREETSHMLNIVRKHFPFQDFLVSDENEDQDSMRILTSLSPAHTLDSGTHVSLATADKQSISLRALVGLALNAMSIGPRQARYEADLVACWASMCNINYGYKKEDSFELALQKVITALRQRGFRIYNFLVNTDGGETDLRFHEYAAAMPHTNSTSGALLLGSPILTGRADTVRHIQHSLSQSGILTSLPTTFDITLRPILEIEIKSPIMFADISDIIKAYRGLVIGQADDMGVADAGLKIGELLAEMSASDPAQLRKHSLLPLSVTVQEGSYVETPAREDINSAVTEQSTIINYPINAWAIIPSHLLAAEVFTARESLNGTLVLATPASTNVKHASIVAYVTMTHQRYGTYLIKADEDGVLDMVFKKQDPFIREAMMESDSDDDLMDPKWAIMDAFQIARGVRIEMEQRKWYVGGKNSSHI